MRAVLLLFRFLRTILIITISVGLCNGNLGVPCKESERQALLLFQKDLEDPSNRLSSCVGEGVCCNWTGVVCDDLTGHVRELHLTKPDSQQDLHSFGDSYGTSTWLGGKLRRYNSSSIGKSLKFTVSWPPRLQA
ncbi:LRR receptor-like serine/threonine-protein kinase GSO1 [Prunus yedoensis var. nudiflora]|uniref:LRR receptor-like serine/threonine-protein kinase GSO1 n=1 Tax=Prunus yedoensis var. nudiflora TaxID=2094558 RepID=A0A314UVU9_PRUYE|nr:LRR receptor-like serine/threonine-protein kinase GSO1 [Prunus yedoensis var. nudiflora]